jgi:hypothetical protein
VTGLDDFVLWVRPCVYLRVENLQKVRGGDGACASLLHPVHCNIRLVLLSVELELNPFIYVVGVCVSKSAKILKALDILGYNEVLPFFSNAELLELISSERHLASIECGVLEE